VEVAAVDQRDVEATAKAPRAVQPAEATPDYHDAVHRAG
jgi:hypothetical protein